ncbi:MAG TPA: ABC transporter substrate-binding protein [Stellaceae bacterium]|nr:ABC transporter substrate-binding protein [Stellaceae bacterium]
MISRRMVLAAVTIAAIAPGWSAGAAADDSPATTISTYYDTLLATMKEGKALGFKGRYDKLAPAVRRAYDLPQMTRIAVGPAWTNLPAEQQQQLVDAFSAFSIATYANQFDDYSGERFEVDHKPTPANNGDMIVDTKLVPKDGDAVTLNYLMRKGENGWQIVDVYLSGTISQLASRRAEFSAVMRRSGAAGLIDVLRKKAAQLAG